MPDLEPLSGPLPEPYAYCSDRMRRDGAFVRGCGQSVRWCVTEASGSLMPVEIMPERGGNLVVSRERGALESLVARVATLFDETVGGDRYVSHFAWCPHADAHRSR